VIVRAKVDHEVNGRMMRAGETYYLPAHIAQVKIDAGLSEPVRGESPRVESGDPQLPGDGRRRGR
jgi:hypothetical protein